MKSTIDDADQYVTRQFPAGKEALVEIKDLGSFAGNVSIEYRYGEDTADDWRTIYSKAWTDVLADGGDSAVIYVDIPDRPITVRAGATGTVAGSAEFRV